jgi:hypothetical protein
MVSTIVERGTRQIWRLRCGREQWIQQTRSQEDREAEREEQEEKECNREHHSWTKVVQVEVKFHCMKDRAIEERGEREIFFIKIRDWVAL